MNPQPPPELGGLNHPAISSCPAGMDKAALLPAATAPVSISARAAIPWRAWVAVGGVACLPIGLLWDISWHSSIGRDTFWTPAHIVIQLGGIVPALLFAWMALQTTFRGTNEDREAAVNCWGVSAPLGAWLTMWGAAAMVVSAPFDDWWHNTYGLDVQIVSPPHSVLGLGMWAVTAGVLLFVFSWQKRTGSESQTTGAVLCALAAGVMITLFSDFLTEISFPNLQHGASFYRITAAVYPMLLVLTARASQLRWAATIAAGTYMGVFMLMIWILPLFPAQPKLAPIYHPVTHMVPPAFPLLLLVPAFGIDLLMRCAGKVCAVAAAPDSAGAWQRLTGWRDWFLSGGVAVAFLALFVPAQWFFAEFLLSDAADNRFFARSGHWPYFSTLGENANRFWKTADGPLTAGHLAVVFVIALISARLGLWYGNYLLKVRR